MYNELKRYVLYKCHYVFDTFSEIIYSIIFIVGMNMLLANLKCLNIVYFFVFFTTSHIIIFANADLEYEIRSGQIDNLYSNNISVITIYVYRYLSYFIYTICIFLLAILVGNIISLDISNNIILTKRLISIGIVNYLIFFALYILMIKLTLKYKRISVAIGFVYTCFLMYSGLVFPATYKYSFIHIIEKIVDIIILK